MATPQVKDLVLHSPAGSSEIITFNWPLQCGSGADKHDNGIDIIDTIKFVCDDVPGIRSAFEETDFNEIDTADYKTMTNLVDKFNKAVDSIVTLEKGTSLPNERLNKFAEPNLLRHILQLVYNAAVSDPDKLNNYEPFSPEVYGETSYELIEQMIKHVNVLSDETFIDLGSGVGQVVLQMAGSFPLKTCIGIEKADVPSRYAERMDQFFRIWMHWFGKRYCDYYLLKGDFLVDEHREKITTSSLVFVNNFAFGPHVDHQLKERFADLRDGARIVSSKSFCPLNFRITDRNLSDIGTIMHVKEIPPLKGSVSWTCKPVSYYLHIIDRAKLEQYFNRLKGNHKTNDDDTVGATTRSSRDKTKREANNTSNSKQMDDTSSASETDMVGPQQISRIWTDWCSSSKGKSSQSDDEENNNFTSTSNSRNIRASTQKKRKKIARKAASAKTTSEKTVIASNAAALTTVMTTTSGNLGPGTKGKKGAAAGRIRKGRGKRSIKIVGLDILHTKTVLSTSVELMSKKLPPAPGCVDQKLTSLTGDMCHEELMIPPAPTETPYALQILLDGLRQQFLAVVENMKSSSARENVDRSIQMERERNQRLVNRTSQLEKQIKVLIDDSVDLLKARMNELGISTTSQSDLLNKAKEIVSRHKELQGMATKLQMQVNAAEKEQTMLVYKCMNKLAESEGKEKIVENFEITPATSHELVLKEIANTLSQRKKLYAIVHNIENEMCMLEKKNDEHQALSAQMAQQSVQLTNVSNAIPLADVSSITVPVNSINNLSKSSSYSKTSRRSREHRTRSQEWPDVPDVGKIEESNPEVLAQKILETGRQIEAGKFQLSSGYKQKEERKNNVRGDNSNVSGQDSALMPAPPCSGVKQVALNHNHNQIAQGRVSASINVKNLINSSSKQVQETPKVVNFEDRLKSIITSALNEDHENRKAQQQPEPKKPQPVPPTVQQQPTQSATHVQQPQSISIYNTASNSKSTHHQITTATSNAHHQREMLNAQHQTLHHQSQQHTKNRANSNSLNSIITVATQGLTHLNATTTISPITPPPPPTPFSGGHGNNIPSSNNVHHVHPQQITVHPQYKTAQLYPVANDKHIATSSSSSSAQQTNHNKYAKNLTINISSGHQHHNSHPSLSHSNHVTGVLPVHSQQTSIPPVHHHSPSTSMLYAAQQQAVAADLVFRRSLEIHHREPSANLEFKTPENMRQMIEENVRSSSASSDSAIHYQPTRDRLLSIDRSSQLLQQPSRPNSSSSQPDYTQVSPAKMALRRHLSQEKLAQQHPGSSIHASSSKTIGDLVNGEIERSLENERTLEISHQSIINAAINMSTVGSAASIERSIINPNAQRPERVNVRLIEETANHSNQRTAYSPISPLANDLRKSPLHLHGQSNLATLAHVAYSQKVISQDKSHDALILANGNKTRDNGQVPSSSTRNTFSTGFSTAQTMRSNELKSTRRDYPTIPLPRAEMKPYLESYFIDDKNPSIDERPSRIPLEGLAASLKAQVLAKMNSYNNPSELLAMKGVKLEAGMKRISPTVQQHPRPSKIPHFSEVHEPIEERSRSNSSQTRQSRNEDDDVIPEDETHWQDRISSGFDRLVAFASTELDKTRRSIDNDTAPSTSCNTSPDSGIAHSNNSDARTFLSTSSSSSQLDIAIPNNNNVNSDQLNDNSSCSVAPKCINIIAPILKSSPIEVIESPPLSEIGLPRTPSPSATPPLITIATSSLYTTIGSSIPTIQPTLKIPLKYQRKSKIASEKHYKKKFCERNWEYDCEDLYDNHLSTNNQQETQIPKNNSYNGSCLTTNNKSEVIATQHKASKFRPKGKDWDWSLDSKKTKLHQNDLNMVP